MRAMWPVITVLVALFSPARPAAADDTERSVPGLPWVETEMSALEPGQYLVAEARATSETFVLEPAKRRVMVFDAKGRSSAVRDLPLPPGVQSDHILAFAVSPDGTSMAWCGADGVVLFHDFQFVRTVSFDDPPALPMDIAIEDDSPAILVSRNFFAPVELFPSMKDNAYVLARIDDRGEVSNLALPLDPTEAGSPAKDLDAQVYIAVDHEGGIWLADWVRYRLRKLSAAGRELLEIVDPAFAEDIQDKPFDAKQHDVGQPLSGGQPPQGASASTSMVLRDVAVGDGLVWLLVNDQAVPHGRRLDVVDPGTGRVTTFSFPSSVPLFGSVDLTSRFVVLGTAREGAPLTLDRSEMEKLVQEKAPDPHRALERTAHDEEGSAP